MSIYSTPLSHLSTADLQDLLTERAVENARLEFKVQAPDKDETLKKVSSFANTFGGFMVVGAKAPSKDGRIEELPGVDEISGYKQKVVDWCFKEASPPITVDVSSPIPVPNISGKVCYIVHVDESELAPHFLNGRRGIWVRTDEFSAHFEARLADEHELQHLLHRRKLTLDRRTAHLERARRRFGTYASRPQTNTGREITELDSLFELCIVPRFPSRPLCKQENLRRLVRSRQIASFRQIGFPASNGGFMTQHESVIVRQPLGTMASLSLFEVNVWGMLFYVTSLEEDYGLKQAPSGIHLYQFVGRLLVFLQHADELLQNLNFTGPILVQTSLTSIRDARWIHFPHEQMGIAAPSARPASGFDDDFQLSISTTAEELHEKRDAIAMEVLQSVFFSVDWSDLVNTQEKLEGLVRKGHGFNHP
jgi:hypothetical protein